MGFTGSDPSCLQHEPFTSVTKKEGHGVRDIVKHDFRSVLLYHMLPNANRMQLSEMRKLDW